MDIDVNVVFPYSGAIPKVGYLLQVPFLWSNKNNSTVG